MTIWWQSSTSESFLRLTVNRVASNSTGAHGELNRICNWVPIWVEDGLRGTDFEALDGKECHGSSLGEIFEGVTEGLAQEEMRVLARGEESHDEMRRERGS